MRTVCSNDPASVLDKAESTYDAICFWHSLEHLFEPWTILQKAACKTRPGGILLISAPNPMGTQARLMGRLWPHHDLPRHLYGLPMPWLRNVINGLGFREEYATTCDQGSLYWSRFSWAMLLKSSTRKQKLQSLLWRIGMLVGSFARHFDSREGHGASYTMVFRRY